jgi:hypothetical protein
MWAKTKSLCSQLGNVRYSISTPAYGRKMTGEGNAYSVRNRQLTQCPQYPRMVQKRNLLKHMMCQTTRSSFSASEHPTSHVHNKRESWFNALSLHARFTSKEVPMACATISIGGTMIRGSIHCPIKRHKALGSTEWIPAWQVVAMVC